LNIKYRSINDISLSQNRHLDDVIDLLSNKVRIANKPLKVEVECAECKNYFLIDLCKYDAYEFHFCSKACYWKYKTHDRRTHGKNNPKYNSKIVNCTNCNKEMLKPKHIQSQTNAFGDHHAFCSKQCYYEYRKKYYVNDKCYQYGTEASEERKEVCRQKTLELYQNGTFNRVTKPQRIVNNILNSMSIKYICEKTIGYYSIDNYLEECDLIIEVMGDYFHVNPMKYADIECLNQIQRKDIIRDKKKNTYIRKYRNINILYLWENEILKCPDLCIDLIKLYVSTKGILSSYNSFNYRLINGRLETLSDMVTSYFNVV